VRHDDPVAVDFTAAIVAGEIERLTELLREHPDLATSRVEDANGGQRSSLHLLADHPGHRPRAAQTLAVLVAAGADLEAQAVGMWHVERPLHWAASNDDVELVDALLDAGADIEAAGSSIDGGSPLSCAVGYGQWSAARRLVDRGARTELWHAAALGLMSVVERLVDGGSADGGSADGGSADGGSADGGSADGGSDLDGPLWNACRGGQLAVARFLVERGASVDWRAPWSGESVRDAARASGNEELIDWLADRG
jgi:hypothetical protein